MLGGRTAGLLVLTVAAFVPVTAYAQGSITGVVRDTSGVVLPGVTVEVASPSLIEKVRVTVSDDTGRLLRGIGADPDHSGHGRLSGFICED
jgi:hypothetical protein